MLDTARDILVGKVPDPKAKLVMAHTAAGNVGDPGFGELLALWAQWW